jgi:glc operon protein GlcG
MTTLRPLAYAFAVVLLAGTGAASAQTPLTLDEALAVIDATKVAAAEEDLRLSIAVVDGRGDLIAMARMPDARPATADTAIGKAMLSAMTGRPSAALAGRGTTSLYRRLNESTGGRLRFFQGAVPIVRDGYTVGAVGSSGASSQADEDAVKAGLAAAGLD